MKFLIVFILGLVAFPPVSFGQEDQTYTLSTYRKYVDSLNQNHLLIAKSLDHMHGCGGAVNGYYFNNELILIDSWYAGEYGGVGQKAYMQDSIIIELEYIENFPDWSQPNGGFEYDTITNEFIGELFETKRIYQCIDNQYLLVFSEGKIQGLSPNDSVLEQLFRCIEMMRVSLTED